MGLEVTSGGARLHERQRQILPIRRGVAFLAQHCCHRTMANCWFVNQRLSCGVSVVESALVICCPIVQRCWNICFIFLIETDLNRSHAKDDALLQRFHCEKSGGVTSCKIAQPGSFSAVCKISESWPYSVHDRQYKSFTVLRMICSSFFCCLEANFRPPTIAPSYWPCAKFVRTFIYPRTWRRNDHPGVESEAQSQHVDASV